MGEERAFPVDLHVRRATSLSLARGVFLEGLRHQRMAGPSPERVAFLRDLSRRRVVLLSPERVAFPRDSSRHKAEIDLPRRKVVHLADALQEVDLAVET